MSSKALAFSVAVSLAIGVLVVASPPARAAVPAGEQVGLVDPSQGLWHLRTEEGRVASFFYGNPGDAPFMGDWDCDGVDTPGLYRQSDGFAYLRNSNTQGIADIRFFFGNPGDVPIPGDFNADGCDTLSLYRPSEQRFYIIDKLGSEDKGLGAAEFSFLFGNPGDTPVSGDWDGDNVDEIGLYRESTGFFYFRNTLTTGIADDEFFFGNPNDRFVAGDWGIVDGVDTPAVFRPESTTFFFRHTNTVGIADSQFVWGHSAWLPVAGNFGDVQPLPGPGDFAPFQISGSGDDVVAVSVPGDAFAVLRFEYNAESNFIVWARDASLDRVDLLVNEIGSYTGGRPVNTNFLGWSGSPLRHLDITASGDWTVTVEPLSMALTLAGSVSGTSDDVVRVFSGGIATFTYTGSSNFIVWAMSLDGNADLLVNEIGDDTGTHVIPAFTEYLDVVGIGDWSITSQ